MVFNVITVAVKITFLSILLSILIITIFYVQRLARHCKGLAAPNYLNLVYVDGFVVASWMEPQASECNLTYALEFTEFGNATYVETFGSHYIFYVNPLPCTYIQLKLRLLAGADERSDALVKTLDFVPTSLSPIGNLQVIESEANVVATWDMPHNYDQCTITYAVEYVSGEQSMPRKFSTLKTKTTLDVDVTTCNVVQLSVTPIVQGVTGPATFHNYTLGACELQPALIEDLVPTICDICEYILLS